jgi:hypothetical protein
MGIVVILIAIEVFVAIVAPILLAIHSTENDDVDGVMRFITSDIELIDALCTLCRKLKTEGVV